MRLARFSLIGLLGAVLQLSLLQLMTQYVHLNGLVAAAAAVEITLLHNFLWHEKFTWRDRSSKCLPQRMTRLWRFHLGNGFISLFGNTVLIYCLAERLKLPVLSSAIAAIGLCSLANFLLADRWVYPASG